MDYTGIVLMLVFLGIFYFLIIRPQQKREKNIREMQNNLKIGDKVVTIGGIYGEILRLREERVVLETEESGKANLTVEKRAISKVV